MAEKSGPQGHPEAYESDDLSRMRRIHEYLDHEFQEIPERHHRPRYGGSVPSVCERTGKDSGSCR